MEAHKVKTGETLDSVAKQAGLNWRNLAFFNWGTKDTNEINKHLAADVGCTKKTADGKNYIFDDSDNPGIVYVPRQWKLPGLGTSQRHLIRVNPISLGKVCVRILVSPETAVERDERFRLLGEDGSYDQVKTAADDFTPGDGFVDLMFANVPTWLRYSFEISVDGGKPEAVFKDIPFAEIDKHAGANEGQAPEDQEMYLLGDCPEDVKLPAAPKDAVVLHVGLPAEIGLFDDELLFLASKKYRLEIDGNEYEGKLNEKGRLVKALPNGAKSGKITIWLDEWDDEGTENDSAIEIPISFESTSSRSDGDDEGAMLRLVNLGYYQGTDPSAICPEAVDAISRFQIEHELLNTGELDDQTRSKLKEVYGN